MIYTQKPREWWVHKLITAVIGIVIACVLTAGFSIGFTVHQQRQADQRWCDLMTEIDKLPRPPHPTPSQLAVRQRLHELRLRLHCDG